MYGFQLYLNIIMKQNNIFLDFCCPWAMFISTTSIKAKTRIVLSNIKQT